MATTPEDEQEHTSMFIELLLHKHNWQFVNRGAIIGLSFSVFIDIGFDAKNRNTVKQRALRREKANLAFTTTEIVLNKQ